MFEVDVCAGLLVNVKTAPFQGADNDPGFEAGKFGRHALDSNFELFGQRWLMDKGIVGNFLAVLVQGADVAEDRVLSHLSSFLNSSSIGNDPRQSWNENVVATFGELFVDDGVAVLDRQFLLVG